MANLLIVDDVEMDRLLETRIVEDAGHAPCFAKDGEAALRVYQENDIDVVITDLRMPNVDGLQLIQDLLAHDPRAAIIAVSGAADQLEKAEKCGALAALEKTFGGEGGNRRAHGAVGEPSVISALSRVGPDSYPHP